MKELSDEAHDIIVHSVDIEEGVFVPEMKKLIDPYLEKLNENVGNYVGE